jgi:hypothetical protein
MHQMEQTILRGIRSIISNGLNQTLRMIPPYIYHENIYDPLSHFEPHINSRTLTGEDLNIVSDKLHTINVNLNTDIASNVAEGSIEINPDTHDRNIIQKYDPLDLREPFVCEISDILLVGEQPLGISRNGYILLDTVFHSHEGNSRLKSTLYDVDIAEYPTIARFVMKKPVRNITRISDGIVLTSRWNNYGHWVQEHALKFRFLEQYSGISETNPTFIMEPNPPDWKFEYLSLMGYEDINIVEYCDSVYLDNLILPSYPEPTLDSFQWLRDRLRENINEYALNSVKSTDRVWISRQNQPCRRIINQKEISQLVRDFGFEILRPEEMSIKNQIAYFSDVNVIAGPNGSAFANMIYSENKNIDVLELFGERVHPGFWRLSNIMNFNHSHLLCEPVGRNMHVNSEALESVLTDVTRN